MSAEVERLPIRQFQKKQEYRKTGSRFDLLHAVKFCCLCEMGSMQKYNLIFYLTRIMAINNVFFIIHHTYYPFH